MRRFAFGTLSTVLLLLCMFLFTLGAANNNGLRRINDAVHIGDSYEQCRARWKSEPSLYTEFDKPANVKQGTNYIVLLHAENHPLLDPEAYTQLEFRNDRLTKTYCNDFWRAPTTGHKGIFRAFASGTRSN